MSHEDPLTGLHANTQIPKVTGLERIASLSGDEKADSGALFLDTVTSWRTVVFGGNSVIPNISTHPRISKGCCNIGRAGDLSAVSD